VLSLLNAEAFVLSSFITIRPVAKCRHPWSSIRIRAPSTLLFGPILHAATFQAHHASAPITRLLLLLLLLLCPATMWSRYNRTRDCGAPPVSRTNSGGSRAGGEGGRMACSVPCPLPARTGTGWVWEFLGRAASAIGDPCEANTSNLPPCLGSWYTCPSPKTNAREMVAQCLNGAPCVLTRRQTWRSSERVSSDDHDQSHRRRRSFMSMWIPRHRTRWLGFAVLGTDLVEAQKRIPGYLPFFFPLSLSLSLSHQNTARPDGTCQPSSLSAAEDCLGLSFGIVSTQWSGTRGTLHVGTNQALPSWRQRSLVFH